jgi:Fe-Mn family superoxide dismutase
MANKISNGVTNKLYALPELAYGYDELSPFISAEQLKIHHQKHHQAYVTGANAILEKLDQARRENLALDYRAELKALSFNIGGHVLHSLFWENLIPSAKGGGKISGEVRKKINDDFGSFDRFKTEFTALAASVEGSGWAALMYYPETGRLLCAQIEKHNVLFTPETKILMVIDVFEHAYYLDYKNERGKFIEAFWQIINWTEVDKRYKMSVR